MWLEGVHVHSSHRTEPKLGGIGGQYLAGIFTLSSYDGPPPFAVGFLVSSLRATLLFFSL